MTDEAVVKAAREVRDSDHHLAAMQCYGSLHEIAEARVRARNAMDGLDVAFEGHQ